MNIDIDALKAELAKFNDTFTLDHIDAAVARLKVPAAEPMTEHLTALDTLDHTDTDTAEAE